MYIATPGGIRVHLRTDAEAMPSSTAPTSTTPASRIICLLLGRGYVRQRLGLLEVIQPRKARWRRKLQWADEGPTHRGPAPNDDVPDLDSAWRKRSAEPHPLLS